MIQSNEHQISDYAVPSLNNYNQYNNQHDIKSTAKNDLNSNLNLPSPAESIFNTTLDQESTSQPNKVGSLKHPKDQYSNSLQKQQLIMEKAVEEICRLA